MGFWSAATTAWRLGREVEGAVDAARESIARGESVEQACRAFAAATGSTDLDDRAVSELARGITQAVDYALRASLAAGRLAAAIEQNAPVVLSAVERGLRTAHGLAQQGATQAERVREVAIKTGVVATKIAIRMEKLKG